MTKLNKLKTKILTIESFKLYPVWTWDEGMENVVPVSESNPSIDDYGDLFIKSKFTVTDYKFDGYLMGGQTYYGFTLFIKNKNIKFNIHAPKLNLQSATEIFELLDCKPFNLFPIRYESDVLINGIGKISGTLNFGLE